MKVVILGFGLEGSLLEFWFWCFELDWLTCFDLMILVDFGFIALM